MEMPTSVLEFWFSEVVKPHWFNSTEAFDQALQQRFHGLWKSASLGELAEWGATPEGALALVIVLDQFPLNMFRGTAKSFSTESMSREVAAEAIDKGFDAGLDDTRKAFLYMPFMHSENLSDQDRSVALYQQAGMNHNLKWARHHREIVRRFGRFPHRNALLGRVSSPQELEYLASKEAFLG